MPAVFNVGPGDVATLISDINTANTNGQSNIINLTASTYDLTAIDNYWYGPNGLPAISSNLTIHGNGAVIQRDSSAPNFRLFYVSGGMELAAGSLMMDNVTLEGGIAKGGDSNHGGGGLGAGGAIFNQGTLNLTDVTLTNNQAIGGSSGVTTAGDGGGSMGQDAPVNGDGGGFGGGLGGTFGGTGGAGASGGGGGGGGFLPGSDGSNATATAPGSGGGRGGFGSTGDGGNGGSSQATNSGAGGNFGFGGGNGLSSTGSGGGGGGVGGGGGAGYGGGNGGFGGGGGAGDIASGLGKPGFGGGYGGLSSGGPDSNVGQGGDGYGGAIFNMGADSAHAGSGHATLINCTLTNNIAQGGTGSTDYGGDGVGGALYNLDGAVNLTNDTIVDNRVIVENLPPPPPNGVVAIPGVNVMNLAYGNDIDTGKPVNATLIISNSILANSEYFGAVYIGDDLTSYASSASTNTATVSGSHNLITAFDYPVLSGIAVSTADPMLGPLQNNGGLTPTMLPQPGSPVLGAGDPALAPATDQRGQPRPPNGPTDLGAVQVSAASTSGSSGGTTISPPNLFQALLSLYLDGAVEAAVGLANAAEFYSPNGFATNAEQAKAVFLADLLQRFRPFDSSNLDALRADINFNLPYAGPFGLFVVAAGAEAVYQAVQ